jgi:hypothetical protein
LIAFWNSTPLVLLQPSSFPKSFPASLASFKLPHHTKPTLKTTMSGRGKGKVKDDARQLDLTSRVEGGKGLGKGGAKRHRKILRDNIQGITKV